MTSSVKTFDNFVVCPENAQAQQAAMLLAQVAGPSGANGPLLIHGGPGVGKTHLLNAIANHDLQWKTLYVSAADMAPDRSLPDRYDRSPPILDSASPPDILLIDDIHLLAGDQMAQQEIFSVIYLAIRSNIAVAVTSRVPPIALTGFEPRLISLLASGGPVRIQLGGRGMRKSMLRSMLEEFTLPGHVLDYLVFGFMEDGHKLYEVASELREKPNVEALLYMLGYRLAFAEKGLYSKTPALVTQWRRESHGETHIVDFAYSLEDRSLLARASCSI